MTPCRRHQSNQNCCSLSHDDDDYLTKGRGIMLGHEVPDAERFPRFLPKDGTFSLRVPFPVTWG